MFHKIMSVTETTRIILIASFAREKPPLGGRSLLGFGRADSIAHIFRPCDTNSWRRRMGRKLWIILPPA